LEHFAAIIALDVNCERLNEILLHKEQTGSEELKVNGGDIEFQDVKFSYQDGKKILDGVSFTAKQGEVTALIGPSGSGKTTVSRLAARFWDVDSGKITVGGQDISHIDPETLMNLYSIVFQDVTLFNNTVMENIRIGDKNATDEQVKAAAKLANCTEFVEQLPDKWNTVIGENGKKLSGGERQRISIARAFLKNAPIILLDEASASLDVENETLIQQSISKLIKGKTVLVIAHRLRTIQGANKIITIKAGKAVV
jgi:ATP-binding cassette subfamily B protein